MGARAQGSKNTAAADAPNTGTSIPRVATLVPTPHQIRHGKVFPLMIAGILSGTFRTSPMPLRNSWNSRAIRTALVEPCEADAYWFRLMAQESRCSMVASHYPTGICALAEWKRVPSAIDLIVVSAMLPMLTVGEFIQAARSVHPSATIVVVGEEIPVPDMEIAGNANYPKPLTIGDIREMVLRVTPIRAHRPKVRNSRSNLPISSMSDVVYGTTV
jgi:hypothetical protein